MPQPSSRPAWFEESCRREGRYVLGPLMGHGGMGDVYEAWDTLLGRVVALKILTHAEPAAMVRFMREAQLQAKIEHPGICRIYDIEAHNGVPRIAMQLVRGPTLEDASNDLELLEIVDLIARVAETLADAHRHGLIHRDVKPGNVILEPQEGGGWNPVICDFGLALAVNESVLTQPNALTGTPAYMAPEQVRGDRRHIGPATDVYGLGGTLYFLLVGRPPCVSTVTKEMLRVKKERRFPLPRALEPSIPEALEAILLRCLAPDPADRYPSMDALAADLLAFLGRSPRRPPPNWLRLAGSAALVLAAALGGLAWHLAARARWSENTVRATMEANDLEEGLRHERALPIHDTREALARLRSAGQGPDRGAAWALVRGTADFCLGNLAAARTELAQAWAGGLTAPETAYRLGIACALQWLDEDSAGQAPTPDLALQAREWFQRAKGLSRDREAYAQALLACLDRDLIRSVRLAREAELANPWRQEAGVLGSRCLIRLAQERLARGEEAAALGAYREALQWAEDGIRRAPSDGGPRHAALAAALGLAEVERTHRRLSLEAVQRLADQADLALQIDPDAAPAQADWLAVQCQAAAYRADRGDDPRPIVDKALAFFWKRTQEPRSPALMAVQQKLKGLVEAAAPGPVKADSRLLGSPKPAGSAA